jgi:hypothetical protein
MGQAHAQMNLLKRFNQTKAWIFEPVQEAMDRGYADRNN